MELLRYLLLALAFANRANALSIKQLATGSDKAAMQMQIDADAEAAAEKAADDAATRPLAAAEKAAWDKAQKAPDTGSATIHQLIDPCRLPSDESYFALLGNGSEKPSDARKHLLDAVASPLRKTTPFIWLHYGDGDFASMGEEGSDLTSDCVRHGLRDMFMGKGENLTSSSHVYQSVGAFFLCSQTFGMERFLTPGIDVAKPKFPFHNDFYFPCGDGPPGKDSWILAARKRKRPIVLVGSKHVDQPCVLNHSAFFEMPRATNGCGDVDRLVPQLVEYSRTKFPNDSVLFAVAGGAIGKMIAYKAFQSLLDKDMFVDVGASLDLFSGEQSRDYGDWNSLCKYNKQWLAPSACKEHCGGNCDKCAAGHQEPSSFDLSILGHEFNESEWQLARQQR